MDHDAQIEAAIADLESQDRRNIAATARRWKVAHEMLSKRFRGETGPNRDATSCARRQLTDVQEQALIKHINYADRNCILLDVLPPHFIHQLQPLDVGILTSLYVLPVTNRSNYLTSVKDSYE